MISYHMIRFAFCRRRLFTCGQWAFLFVAGLSVYFIMTLISANYHVNLFP